MAGVKSWVDSARRGDGGAALERAAGVKSVGEDSS